MASWVYVMWLLAMLHSVRGGVISSTTQKKEIPCGDWTFYSEDKCIKVITDAGLHTQNDAEHVCETFDEDLNSFPRLLTVKSAKEEEFIVKYIFDEHNIADNVWLGLKRGENGIFVWNDGSDVHFSRWAKQNMSDGDRHCVQMESGHGANVAVGYWVMVTCRKSNIVVCERQPKLTLTGLQNKMLNAKLQLEHVKGTLLQKLTKANSEIGDLKQKTEASEKLIFALTQKYEQTEEATGIMKENFTEIIKEVNALNQRNAGVMQKVKGLSVEQDTSYLEIKAVQNKTITFEKQISDILRNKNISDVELNILKQNAERKTLAMKQLEGEMQILAGRVAASETEITQLKHKSVAAEEGIKTMEQDLVPIGYVYVQLPDQKSPSLLWSGTKWEDISEKYDSLFFRVVGKNAAPFGQPQEQKTVHLTQVKQKYMNHDDKAPYVPLDGSWSNDVVSGGDRGGPYIGLQFRLTTGEVRPRNKAVRIWQRIE